MCFGKLENEEHEVKTENPKHLHVVLKKQTELPLIGSSQKNELPSAQLQYLF